MADKQIVVTAPYVTLRTRDALGAWVVTGAYEGGRFAESDVHEDSLRHHLDSGLVAYVEDAEKAGFTAGGKPVLFDESGAATVQQAEVGSRPHGNASRDAWAAYAATKGAPEDETKAVDEGGLSRDELRSKYGS